MNSSSNIHSYVFRLLILGVIILLTGCTQEEEQEQELITKVNFEKAEFAPFVENNFPFITTSLDARTLGPGFPDNNLSPRCLALRLGEDAYACFDTDMLRWSVAWTGEFLPMVTMGQISYRDFHNKGNQIPKILGTPKVATGLYPGWSASESDFTDPRPPRTDLEAPTWGPIPEEIGRWDGVYLHGRDVVLSYTIQNTDIYEKPGTVNVEGDTAFTRTIRAQNPKETLFLIAAEVSNGLRSEVTGNAAYIYQGANEDSVTAIGLADSMPGVELNVTDNRYSTVQLSAGNENLTFTLVIWKGAAEDKDHFEQMLAGTETEMPDFRNGGSAYWTETVTTQGQIAPDTSAYVVDQLTLPIPNPWHRNVRVVDVAFFEGSRAAVVTFSGDIWMVDGIDQELTSLSWRRYASGLYEPQSIEIVDGTVYIYGKEGIVRFHDLNDDGVADYYENFSNLMAQSLDTREWATGLIAVPGGGFYISKGAALTAGPETSFPAVAEGFRAGSRHSGSILKVSDDGHSIEPYATGFRGPYMGINPETAVLTASDQQGNFVPSTPLLIVEQGDYFGVPATSHREPIPEITPPLVWFPHSVDRSGMSQVWITSEKMGPLSGHLVHISYGKPGLFKVLIDSTGDAVQGAVTDISAHWPAPTMKGAINPEDGQLYLTGFSLWGSNSSGVSAFTRLRYTGMTSLLPEKFQVREGGVMIRFTTKLDKKAATNPGNYQVRRWNYKRTEEYGSGHYKIEGSPGEDFLPVFSAHLSDDQKAVFLVVPNIKKVMQMQVSYNMKSSDGAAMESDLWFTVNEVEKMNLLAEGFSNFDLEELVAENDSQITTDQTEQPASLERGKQLFENTGCIGCHSTDGITAGMYGPTLKGLFGTKQQFEDGSAMNADELYIKESILEPGKKIVKGYDAEMPSFLGILSDNEIESITMYIKSLSDI